MVEIAMPSEWLTLMGMNVVVSMIGMSMGVVWIGASYKYKKFKWVVVNRMSAVVFTLLMTLGLVLSYGYNIKHIEDTKESIESIIKETVENINQELNLVVDHQDMKKLINELYDAGYRVDNNRLMIQGEIATIGDRVIRGDGSGLTTQAYIESLSEEERIKLFDTDIVSLDNFSELELAYLDTQIRQDAYKSGSRGRETVNEGIEFQRGVLRSNINKNEYNQPTVKEYITTALVISGAFMVLSVLLAIFMYIVVRETIKETGLRGVRLLPNRKNKKGYEEFDLIDDELVDKGDLLQSDTKPTEDSREETK